MLIEETSISQAGRVTFDPVQPGKALLALLAFAATAPVYVYVCKGVFVTLWTVGCAPAVLEFVPANFLIGHGVIREKILWPDFENDAVWLTTFSPNCLHISNFTFAPLFVGTPQGP